MLALAHNLYDDHYFIVVMHPVGCQAFSCIDNHCQGLSQDRLSTKPLDRQLHVHTFVSSSPTSQLVKVLG